MLVATEVERLQAMNQHGLGSDKTEILMKRYEELAEIYAETTESTLALHQLAMLYREKDELVEARKFVTEPLLPMAFQMVLSFVGIYKIKLWNLGMRFK